MFAAILLAQAPVLDVFEADRRAFKPYRDCVIAAASKYEQTGESVSAITDAALSECRSQKTSVLMDFMENYMDALTRLPARTSAKAINNSDHFDTLETMLRQDVANQVLKRRVK